MYILAHVDDFPTVIELDFYISPRNVIAGWQKKVTWCFFEGEGEKQTLVLGYNLGKI